MIKFFGDPAADLTKALDVEMTHPGPPSVGIIGRCKRHAVYAVNGEVKFVAISEGPDDPAGKFFISVCNFIRRPFSIYTYLFNLYDMKIYRRF